MIGYQSGFCHTTLEEIAFAITGLGPHKANLFSASWLVVVISWMKKVACFHVTRIVAIGGTEGRPQSETEKNLLLQEVL